MKKYTCSCCGAEINAFQKRNPEPVFQEPKTTVCVNCYKNYIVPARKAILRTKDERIFEEYFKLTSDRERFMFLHKRGLLK